jgi:hypothetical protein
MPNPTVELWTLYALAVSFTILRTYARVVAVGFRELCVDDYLIWLAIVRITVCRYFAAVHTNLSFQLIYSAQCTLGYSVGVLARGLANNGMSDAQRSALSPNDSEYGWRYVENNKHRPAQLTLVQSHRFEDSGRGLDHSRMFAVDA